MQIDLRKEAQSKERPVAGPNIQSRSSKSRKGQNIEVVPDDSKIPVEIRDIILIKPQDFHALKNSFEEWASQWN